MCKKAFSEKKTLDSNIFKALSSLSSHLNPVKLTVSQCKKSGFLNGLWYHVRMCQILLAYSLQYVTELSSSSGEEFNHQKTNKPKLPKQSGHQASRIKT